MGAFGCFFGIGEAIEVDHGHACGQGRVDSDDGVIDGDAVLGGEAHDAGGMQVQAGVRLPAVGRVAAEQAIAEHLGQAHGGKRGAHLVFGAVGNHAHGVVRQRGEGLGGTGDGGQVGGQAAVEVGAHARFQHLEVVRIDLTMLCLEGGDDIAKARAAKVAHIVLGPERQSGGGEADGHLGGQQGFTVHQGTVTVEQQAEGASHGGDLAIRCVIEQCCRFLRSLPVFEVENHNF